MLGGIYQSKQLIAQSITPIIFEIFLCSCASIFQNSWLIEPMVKQISVSTSI